jgi:DMSO/TMAO reductase YedYZ molybdopterin-dependent catalytic subunit
MTCMVLRRLVQCLVAAAVFVAGSSATANADDPSPTTAAASGTVAVTGDVRTPKTLTVDEIRALPPRTQPVTFESSLGPQSHTYVGTALSDVVTPAIPDVDESAKRPLLSVAILAIGSDGYSAAVGWAETAPDLTATPVLVAYTQDGQPLDQPRLVVPGDLEGARYVSNLIELRLVNLAHR